jgi:hypothetical protein
MFSEILVPDILFAWTLAEEPVRTNLEWLCKQGIITPLDTPSLFAKSEINNLINIVAVISAATLNGPTEYLKSFEGGAFSLERFLAGFIGTNSDPGKCEQTLDLFARSLAANFALDGRDVVPLLSDLPQCDGASLTLLGEYVEPYEHTVSFDSSAFGITQPKRSTILSLALDQMPYPSETTSWEQIIEFRNDEDTKRKLLALRVGLLDLASDDESAHETVLRLQHALNEYETHMKVARMKADMGKFEAIFQSVVSLGLSALNPISIAKLPLTWRSQQIGLLEAELSAPGREFAIISKARQTFK